MSGSPQWPGFSPKLPRDNKTKLWFKEIGFLKRILGHHDPGDLSGWRKDTANRGRHCQEEDEEGLEAF